MRDTDVPARGRGRSKAFGEDDVAEILPLDGAGRSDGNNVGRKRSTVINEADLEVFDVQPRDSHGHRALSVSSVESRESTSTVNTVAAPAPTTYLVATSASCKFL